MRSAVYRSFGIGKIIAFDPLTLRDVQMASLKSSIVTKSEKKGRMSSIFSISDFFKNIIADLISSLSLTTCSAERKKQKGSAHTPRESFSGLWVARTNFKPKPLQQFWIALMEVGSLDGEVHTDGKRQVNRRLPEPEER